MQNLIAPYHGPLEEHSENILHILIGITMYAQSTDEIQDIQTSSIHNSSIKCRNDECFSIPESHFRALHNPSNETPKKSTSKVSSQSQRRQLKLNLHYLTIENFYQNPTPPLEPQYLEMGGRSNKIQHPKKKNLENLTLKPNPKT
jgi:hypothetical protein